MSTIWRVPLSMTAEFGTVTDLSLASYRQLYLANIAGFRSWPGFGQFNPNRHRPRFGLQGRVNIRSRGLRRLCPGRH